MSSPTSTNPANESLNSNSLPAIAANVESAGASGAPTSKKKFQSAKFKSSLSENNLKIPNSNSYSVNNNNNGGKNNMNSKKVVSDDTENSIKSVLTTIEPGEDAGSLLSTQGMEQEVKVDEENCKSDNFNEKDNTKDLPGAPKSSPTLSCSKAEPSSSKHSWSNFDSSSKGKKNRKERKERKKGITYQNKAKKNSLGGIMKDSKNRSDEPEVQKVHNQQQGIEDEDYVYKYNLFPKNSKSVVFTNDVLVVYFNGDDVVCECNEPLKKEVEQQVRNKEMRRGHLIKAQEKYNLCLF